jgi:hypothetical protein
MERRTFLCSLAGLSLAAATAGETPAKGFRFAEVNDRSLELWEDERPVFVYNHGVISKDGVPADRNRSSYLHPIFGLDGEVITDDFPKDHYHHRGLFWAWPHVTIDGKEYSNWDIRGIETRFERWLERKAESGRAVLGVQNGWYAGGERLVSEQVRIRVHPVSADGRTIDVDLAWTPLGRPLTLAGAEGKSYGGFTLRFAPHEDLVITTPKGNGKDDLPITRLEWADLSARFSGAAMPSGAAVFIHPKHPDYPPEWLTRHYGVLCVGYPGVKAATFPPDKPIRCRYRVWIHRGAPDQSAIAAQYRSYVTAVER